jgi:hypothetical protein
MLHCDRITFKLKGSISGPSLIVDIRTVFSKNGDLNSGS